MFDVFLDVLIDSPTMVVLLFVFVLLCICCFAKE